MLRTRRTVEQTTSGCGHGHEVQSNKRPQDVTDTKDSRTNDLRMSRTRRTAEHTNTMHERIPTLQSIVRRKGRLSEVSFSGYRIWEDWVHCQLLYGYRVTNFNRMLLHNVEHIESEELDRQVVQIMQLIGVREGTVVLPGFTRDDVDQLLDVLCCDWLLVTVGRVHCPVAGLYHILWSTTYSVCFHIHLFSFNLYYHNLYYHTCIMPAMTYMRIKNT